MKILEFNDRGLQVERDANSVDHSSSASSLAPAPKLKSATSSSSNGPSDIQLYMFQTGTLRTKTKFIKMNQGEDDFEIILALVHFDKFGFGSQCPRLEHIQLYIRWAIG